MFKRESTRESIVKSRLLFSVFLILAVLTGEGKSPAQPLNPLRVSSNGRFLIHSDGSPFFPLADTAWAIAWNLDRDQVANYLQHRKQQKFNMIALVAIPSYDDKLMANRNGDQPFEIENGKYNPLKPVVTAGNDPADADQYDYWDHLEYVIDTAASNGFFVVLLPSWGGHVAGSYGTGKDTSRIIIRQPQAYRYGHWIGNRFRKKKNVIWMLGGDRSAVYGEKNYCRVFDMLAEGIADGVNGVDQPDGKADFSTTLISYHPQKWAPNSSRWFHHADWLDFNSIQDTPRDQIASIHFDYELTPAKPTWLFEGGYEHRRNELYRDWQIRFQSYQTVFAGGFGVTYGNMNIYHMSGPWEKSMDDPGSLQMRHLLELMTSFSKEQFLSRVPDQSLIEGEQGTMQGAEGDRSDRIQATRGAKGDFAMIYFANGRPVKVRMARLAAPAMNAYWFNPRNGKWRAGGNESISRKSFAKKIPSGPGTSSRLFTPPGQAGDGNDWVLLLEHQS